jgi:hypothetical protein
MTGRAGTCPVLSGTLDRKLLKKSKGIALGKGAVDREVALPLLAMIIKHINYELNESWIAFDR